MLPQLSVELLEEIASELTQTDHGNLRAVCKDLGGAMQRLFYSCLILRTGAELQSENGRKMLKALANGETGWPVWARTLRITPGKSTGTVGAGQPDGVDSEIQNLFASALKSMQNIRAVTWEIRDGDLGRSWKRDIVCNFLNTLPALDELQLETNGTVDLAGLHPSGIRKFVFKTPSWTTRFRARLSSGNTLPVYMYQDITRLITQNRLTSLHLEGPTECCALLWRTLKDIPRGSRVQPTEITTNVVTPELFDYLASYSGIRKLTLIFPDGGSRDKTDRLADAFFETVVPRHAPSLVELSCPAGYESRFSFGPHNFDVISRLKHLVALKISVNAGRVQMINRAEVDQSVDIEGKRISYATVGTSVQAEQSDIDPVVGLLLQMAATLTALRNLTVLSAETESNRGVWCGNGRIHHQGAVNAAIERAVQTFRSDRPCSAAVHCNAGYHTYESKPIFGEETLASGDSDSKPDILFGYFQAGARSSI